MNTNTELFALSSSPHVKHKNNTQRIMLDVIIALLPAFIWSAVVFGWRPIMLTADQIKAGRSAMITSSIIL